MGEQVGVAVVGLGAVARAVHLPILTRRADLFEIRGIHDLSPQAMEVAGGRFGIPADRRYHSLERMLDDGGAEALVILASGSHGETVLAGLKRGLVVFSEKPLAYTLAELEAVAGALAGRADRLMVGYMKAYDPAVTAAVRLLAGRPRPRSVEVTVLHPTAEFQLATSELDPHRPQVPAELLEPMAARSRALEKEALGEAAGALGPLYSGILLGSLVHDLAVLRRLGLDLQGVDHADRWPSDAFPPSFSVLGRTADQVRVSIRWHYLDGYPAYREEVRLHHEDGSLALVFPSPYLLRAPTELVVTRLEGSRLLEERHVSHVEAFEEELTAFHRMATEGAPPVDGLEEARADTLICQRIAAELARREGIPLGGEAAG